MRHCFEVACIKPAKNHCSGEAPYESTQYRGRPIKVLTRPWLSRHQGFGIFIVPNRYRRGRSYWGTISVPGLKGKVVPDWQPQDQRVAHVVAESGYYLIRGYIRTRITLCFLFTGQFGDLWIPCNWTLEFVRRTTAMEVDQ